MPAVAGNVRNLIQDLIHGVENPKNFAIKLQSEMNSSPQPCLAPFLERSLPFLQSSLLSGELTIDGIKVPSTPRSNLKPARPTKVAKKKTVKLQNERIVGYLYQFPS